MDKTKKKSSVEIRGMTGGWQEANSPRVFSDAHNTVNSQAAFGWIAKQQFGNGTSLKN